MASSRTPATHCRTATTPTGPITGKASAPIAAPTWLDRPLPSIMATPADAAGAPGRPSGGAGAGLPLEQGDRHGPDMRAALLCAKCMQALLYAVVMDLELRHLRCLIAIVDAGSFTDAAIALGVSQAAVSRTLLSLEAVLGVRLLHRTSRSVTPTTAGVQVLARARRLLAEADDLVREATTGHTRLRIGHAWSAMGRHTPEFQRRWAARTRRSNCS